MSVPEVTLTGDAIRGLIVNEQHRLALFDETPVPESVPVKLGRNLPKFHKPVVAASQLMKYLRNVPIPDSVDWYTKAAPALARMYLNDRYGDCVFAGKAHNLGIWSYNDADSGGPVQATDAEIKQQYFDYTGGSDSGAIISEVYDYMKSQGFLAGGKRYQIAGYITCDWTSKELTQACIAVFGAGSIGINLPNAWTSANVWDVTSSGIVGGHDVSPCGYGASVVGTTADGVVISSWGRLYVITWAAWTSRRWLDECFFAVPTKLWTGDDKLAPSGATYDQLLVDLKMAEQGQTPPIPGPPSPPVPPVPPVPPAPPEHQFCSFPSLDVPVTVAGFRIATAHIPPVHMDVQSHADAVEGAIRMFSFVDIRMFSFVDVWQIARHALAIWSAIKNDQALKDAINALLADFGIPPILTIQRSDVKMAATVNYWTIAADVLAIVQAVRTSGPFSAQTAAAVAKLLADLGLSQ